MLSTDGDSNVVSITEALNPENILAYERDGKPLPVMHGFPLRTIFPGEQGNKWVKWVVELTIK